MSEKSRIRSSVPNDRFAEIAAQSSQSAGGGPDSTRDRVARKLASPRRVKSAEMAKPLPGPRNSSAPRDVALQIAQERKRLRRFLADVAPSIRNRRTTKRLKTFEWRCDVHGKSSTNLAEDLSCTGWRKVTLPHYGPPTGKATAWYRTTFDLSRESLEGRGLWIAIEGADYLARVYVNGRCVGQHEGFFARFEFEIGRACQPGKNSLLIELCNDGVWQEVDGVPEGEKLYGATGPGWDEPGTGWHHCPAGMGIIGDVKIESRARLFISDAWVRTLPSRREVEVSVEVTNTDATPVAPRLSLELVGKNHRSAPVVRQLLNLPTAANGSNRYVAIVPLKQPRLWSPATPWLYQLGVTLQSPTGEEDTFNRVFGVRTFEMAKSRGLHGVPTLNGTAVRLRGANTMGFEQQSVMRGDLDQLVDDLILAKLTNFNFLRLTQRPVQTEVYEAASRVGLMLQTDLPLFGYLRRTKFVEAVRQAAEMARHVRAHPSAVLLSFINEPFPAKWRDVSHRHCNRSELEAFFSAAEAAVRLESPDAQIKPVDGDYDPPAPGMPDFHIYTLWYQGHGIAFGRLHQGEFPSAKEGWALGSGEYGAEGLDPLPLMRRRYPASWLPKNREEERLWSPDRIPHAQTGRHQGLFFDRPSSLREWVHESQAWQARAVALQTEAYRRIDRLWSCAVHLFIDAWPAGWMKSLVDCERRPKPAWFACRDALAPWLPMLRSDRTQGWSGERVPIELWLANDTNNVPRGWSLVYETIVDGTVHSRAVCPARPAQCAPALQGVVNWGLPSVQKKSAVLLRVLLLNERRKPVAQHSLTVGVWPKPPRRPSVRIAGDSPIATSLIESLEGDVSLNSNVVIVDKWPTKARSAQGLIAHVRNGGTVVVVAPSVGTFRLESEEAEVVPCGFGPVDFVSCASGHATVDGMTSEDFRFWHDSAANRIEPICAKLLKPAKGWEGILLSTQAGWGTKADAGYAAAEYRIGAGRVRLVCLDLLGRVRTNPAADFFLRRLLS